MYERFTDRARKVMQLALQEAQRFSHEFVGTEHILLGLVKEGNGTAANALKNLGVDLRTIRTEVERIIQPGAGGGRVVTGRLPHTPRAKKVIDYAIEESRTFNHTHVGTEHLLLGLLREQEGVAAHVLIHLGAGLDRVREAINHMLGRPVAAPVLPEPFRGLDTVLGRLRDIRAEAIAAAKFVEAAWFHDQIKTLEQVRDAVAARLGSN